jgi:hypothetical protein
VIKGFQLGKDKIKLGKNLQFSDIVIVQGKGALKGDTLIRNRKTKELLFIIKELKPRSLSKRDFNFTILPVISPPVTSPPVTDPPLGTPPGVIPTTPTDNTQPPVPSPTNQPPQLQVPSSFTLEEDNSQVIAFKITDADTAPEQWVVSVEAANTVLLPQGSLVLGGTGNDRTLTISPAADQNGTTRITLTVSDGKSATQQTFDVTVTAVNDALNNQVPTAQTTLENTPLQFTGSNAILIQDIDAGTQPIQVTLTATQGVLTLSQVEGLSFEIGDGTADSELKMSGTLQSINAALNGLQFDPSLNFDGAATIQITSGDGMNTPAGIDSDTIEIAVVNNPIEIKGKVWNDLNANGRQDDSETGLSGQTVFLDSNQNGLLDVGERTATTNAEGNYSFTNLAAGRYTVGQVIANNWMQTSPGFAGGAANIFLSTFRRDHVFDPVQKILYISRAYGTIERYRMDTEEWLPAIEVRNNAYEVFNSVADLATSIYGIDITPDGKTLYVAEGQRNATQGFIHKIDVATGEVTQLPYNLARGEGGAWDIATTANGLALFTAQFEGSGWVPLRQIDVNTNAISIRTDVKGSGFGEVRQNSLVSASGDRDSLFFTESNISSGPIFTFDSSTNTFPIKSTTSTSLSNALSTVSRDGTLIAMLQSGTVQIRNATTLAVTKTLSGLDGGIIFDPIKDILYAIDSISDQVVAYSTQTWSELYRLNIQENATSAAAFENGVMSISSDGKFLAVSTSTGVRILGLPGFNASSIRTFDLLAGQSASLDFGTRLSGQSSQLSGKVWNDGDRNGIQDSGETGLSGRTVFLDQNRNGLLDSGEVTQITDAEGSYRFTNLTARLHTVTQVLPVGWSQTSPGQSAVQGAGASSTLIPVANARDLIFDSTRDRLYITTSDGKVQRYDLGTKSLLTALTVGTSLNGGDITADGGALYIAENQKGTTQASVYKIDLATEAVTTLNYTPDSGEAGVWDVAIGSAGRALVSSRFAGSGSVPLRQIDLSNDTFSVRSDAPGFFSKIQQDTLISRSFDRTQFFMTGPNSSAGPIASYNATSNNFPKSAEINGSNSNALSAVNRDGSLIAMELGSGVAIMDRNFNGIENLVGMDGGIAFDPTDDLLYAASSKTDQIIAYDTNTWKERYRFAVGEDILSSSSFGRGTMAVSNDYLFLSTGAGVRMFDLAAQGLPKAHNVTLGFGQTLNNLNFGNVSS